MAKNSKIEWCDHTANFWWGCQKVSPGCKNCYAETMVNRWQPDENIWGPAKNTHRQRKKAVWDNVYRWDEKAQAEGVRRRVFVQSMSDFFEDHPDVTEWRKEAIGVMLDMFWLDFLILTKRPENVMGMVPELWQSVWPDHIWIGTSVEDQQRADERIPELLKIPTHVRFLSCEPLLGPVDLTAIQHDGEIEINALNGDHGVIRPLQGRSDAKISWVIVGGESGPGKRPMKLEWARSIRDQCQDAGVPFFVKQVDKVQPIPDDLMIREFPQ